MPGGTCISNVPTLPLCPPSGRNPLIRRAQSNLRTNMRIFHGIFSTRLLSTVLLSQFITVWGVHGIFEFYGDRWWDEFWKILKSMNNLVFLKDMRNSNKVLSYLLLHRFWNQTLDIFYIGMIKITFIKTQLFLFQIYLIVCLYTMYYKVDYIIL